MSYSLFQTRAELREALENELRAFDSDRELAMNQDISWNYVEFEVNKFLCIRSFCIIVNPSRCKSSRLHYKFLLNLIFADKSEFSVGASEISAKSIFWF